MELTEKQKAFYKEYITDANATQAAIRAGYSKKTAYSQGQRLLKKVEGQKFLQELMAQMEKDKIATQDEILKYLTSVMRGESRSEVMTIESPDKGITETKRVMKAPDEKEKLKAAELLAKRYGLLSDKVNLEVAIPVVISGDDELEE